MSVWQSILKCFSRPVWRRANDIVELLISDLYVLVVFMIVLYLAHSLAHFLGVDTMKVGSHLTVGDIFVGLHVANLLCNGLFCLLHMIRAHRSRHD